MVVCRASSGGKNEDDLAKMTVDDCDNDKGLISSAAVWW